MTHKIDLVWLTDDITIVPEWTLGQIWTVKPDPHSVNQFFHDTFPKTSSYALLFWRDGLGPPQPEVIGKILHEPGQVWHAGYKLGTENLTQVMSYVRPTWMFNVEADKTIPSTSWRISLYACLILRSVIDQMDGIYPTFETLEMASLELGYRYLTNGIIVRYVPWMLPDRQDQEPVPIPYRDTLLLAKYCFKKWQYYWLIIFSVLMSYAPVITNLISWYELRQIPNPKDRYPFNHEFELGPKLPSIPNVTVLIPTLDRYSYLKKLLEQLVAQTILPLEILVIDQTPKERRQNDFLGDFTEFPVRLIELDQVGQCISRNLGLQNSKGDYVLFLDDDDEVKSTLIEQHLWNMLFFRADVSSGAADEVGAGSLPKDFTYIRVSDVFPTNNTMIKREVLHQSGLFDLAYNRRRQEDGDLGIRVCLSGALMIYNPEIRILHHHAPQGGLRTHKERVVTFASSRRKLFHRNILSASELYLCKRYFNGREMLALMGLNIFGTFVARGNLKKRLLKMLISTLLLPNTVFKLRKNYNSARNLLRNYPQIPNL